MSLPRTILAPTDFSAHAEQAFDYAVALAAKLEATIHLLNVVTPAVLGAQLGFVVDVSLVEGILGANRAALDKLVDARASKANFGSKVVELGDARAVIAATARKLGADLIVMGTHGRRGLSRVFLGSVAEAVARMSPCPVLLVRADNGNRERRTSCSPIAEPARTAPATITSATTTAASLTG